MRMSSNPSNLNSAQGLTHIDDSGQARMVNVGDKPDSKRFATASAVCRMQSSTATMIQQNQLAKGDVLHVARLAAIMAAKRTDELIPLCHSIPLNGVEVAFEWLGPTQLKIAVDVQSTGKTGVEMEAMVAVSIAALTIYDMCKAVDRTMSVEVVQLESKSGGVRGDFRREIASATQPVNSAVVQEVLD